jgi:hypothetical protein
MHIIILFDEVKTDKFLIRWKWVKDGIKIIKYGRITLFIYKYDYYCMNFKELLIIMCFKNIYNHIYNGLKNSHYR